MALFVCRSLSSRGGRDKRKWEEGAWRPSELEKVGVSDWREHTRKDIEEKKDRISLLKVVI